MCVHQALSYQWKQPPHVCVCAHWALSYDGNSFLSAALLLLVQLHSACASPSVFLALTWRVNLYNLFLLSLPLKFFSYFFSLNFTGAFRIRSVYPRMVWGTHCISRITLNLRWPSCLCYESICCSENSHIVSFYHELVELSFLHLCLYIPSIQ